MEKVYKINQKIYSDEFVKQAIVDFEEVAEIKYLNGDLIILGENDLEIDEIFNEFGNYLIGLFNEQ